MSRLALFFLWLGLLGGVAMAEIFRCRDANGVLVFTDDPANLPPDCQPEQPTEGSGGLNIVPTPPVPPRPPAVPEPFPQQVIEKEKRSQQLQAWTEQAASLAKDYREAASERYRTSFASKRRKLRERIREIKERRDEILKELADARLSPMERAGIEKNLGTIPP